MEPRDPYQGDPLLRAVVERALEPYSRLPPEQVRQLRDFLIVHATTHPAIAPLYERLRRRTVVENSGAQTVVPANGAAAVPPRAANDD